MINQGAEHRLHPPFRPQTSRRLCIAHDIDNRLPHRLRKRLQVVWEPPRPKQRKQ